MPARHPRPIFLPMVPEELPDFPSEPTAHDSGRIYQIQPGVRLLAFPVPTPLPHARDGSLVYAFLGPHRVGAWGWARDTGDLRDIMAAYRKGTSKDYEPPDHRAPGGEHPHIRPPIQNLLKKAMEAARPDALDRARRDQPTVIEFNPFVDDP